jgi:hypothetical protein
MINHTYICCEHTSVDYTSKRPSPEHRIDLGVTTSVHLCEECYSRVYRKIEQDVKMRSIQAARKMLDGFLVALVDY